MEKAQKTRSDSKFQKTAISETRKNKILEKTVFRRALLRTTTTTPLCQVRNQYVQFNSVITNSTYGTTKFVRYICEFVIISAVIAFVITVIVLPEIDCMK